MLFVTNRIVVQGLDPAKGTEITFGADADEAANLDPHGISRSVLFCRRHGFKQYKVVGSDDFFAELGQSAKRQILIYIHGYNNRVIEEIFTGQALKLQQLFDDIDPNWIEVVPIMWPCERDKNIVSAYWDDQKTALASTPTLQRMVEIFLHWQDKQNEAGRALCRKWINVAAHSMGNRLLVNALAGYEQEEQAPPRIFRNIFMFSADVPNEVLEKQRLGGAVPRAARHVVVYHADDDLAMRASKVANLRNAVATRRLGHTGPEHWRDDVLSKNVYAADCSDFNNTYDDPKGHSYLTVDDRGQPGSAFLHMADALWRGRVATDDASGRQIVLPKHGYEPPASSEFALVGGNAIRR